MSFHKNITIRIFLANEKKRLTNRKSEYIIKILYKGRLLIKKSVIGILCGLQKENEFERKQDGSWKYQSIKEDEHGSR